MSDTESSDRDSDNASAPSPRKSGEFLPRRVDVGKNMLGDSKVFFNLGQEVVITTKDKLKLSLIASVPSYSDKGVVIGKASIAVALVLAILTTDTKEAFGLSAQTWSVLLVLFTVGAAIWTIADIVKYARGNSIDDIVEEIIRDSRQE